MSNLLVESESRAARGGRALITLRLLVAVVSLAILLLQEYRAARVPVSGEHVPAAAGDLSALIFPLVLRPEGLIVILMCLLSILYLLCSRRVELAPKMAALQIAVDLGLITALVYHTGGMDSPFVALYFIVIVAAAFVLSWRGAYLMAALAATLFSLLTLSYGLEFIPETYRQRVGEAQAHKYQGFTGVDYVTLLLLPVCAFFLVAFLAGSLARRLRLTRMLHHEVLEGIGEGILLLDVEQRILYQNREIGTLLLERERLEERTLREVLGAAVEEQATRALAERAPRRFEITHHRKDGRLVPFDVRVLPVHDPKGPPEGLIVVLDDITAEKKIEEFYKHKQRLEAMGQLSATIAHEIRNPLASIRGAVQEIARSVEIPESKKILIEIVLSESDRLDQIITDFLRYARVRPPKLAAVDLCQFLSELRLLLVSRHEAQGVQVSLEAQEDVEPIRADAEQLRQVFLNLGLNALQAVEERPEGAPGVSPVSPPAAGATPGAPERRVLFRVRACRFSRLEALFNDPEASVPGDRVDRPGVLVEIVDTGRGMTAEVRKQIFEPFFTTKPEGTGLGLAIVDRLIQAHEGLIHVTSQPGAGATFRVWLPADLQSEVKDEESGKQKA